MADIPGILNQPIFNAPTSPGISWLTAIVVALIAAIAGALAPWIVHSTKISEFRQAWINDLRKDIADYIGAAEKWFAKYHELNDLDAGDPEKFARIRKEADPIANKAKVILARIKMRFNPRKNDYHSQDNEFLETLDDLLNPGKMVPPNLLKSWNDIANRATEQAREILKREWEVTKRIPVPWRRRFAA